MKKRFFIYLILLALFVSVPVLSYSVDSTSFMTASAVEETHDVTTLKALVASIPAQSTWEKRYVNTANLYTWYSQAQNIIANPESYNQNYIDNITASLSTAYSEAEGSLHATGITISSTTIFLDYGEHATINCVLTPTNAADEITWTSSDSNSVSVTSSGRIDALKYTGKTVTIKATCNGYSASCKVIVTNPLTNVKLSVGTSTDTSKTIYETQSFTLTATPVAKDGSANVLFESNSKASSAVTYTWNSSNPACATVDEDGKVKGISYGGTTITCVAQAGSKKITKNFTVNVEKLIPVETLTRDFTVVDGYITMVKGETEILKVNILPTNATIADLKWTSSDTSILKISSSSTSSSVSTAKVSAVDVGTCKLTYKATDGSDVTGSVKVKILPQVSKISLSTTCKVLPVDSIMKITADITPDDAGNKVVKWTTTDSDVCSVDSNGKVTAKSRGTAIITATATDGSGVTAACRIRVAPQSTSITLKAADSTIDVGNTTTITPTITTTEGTTYNDFVSWSSSDKTIATVDQNGIVTAVAPGTVTITGKTTDILPNEATCKIKVVAPVKAVSCTSTKTIAFKASFTLKPTFTPTNATNKNVTYSSSDTSIATVTSAGVVTAKSKSGTCKITIKTKDGGYKAVCKVTVYQPTTAVKLSASAKAMEVKDKITLKATVSPSNATNKTITWSSSNKKVATVDSNGKVTAVAGGSCTITAKTADNKTAKCSISVTEYATSLAFKRTSYGLYIGQKYTVSPVVTPSTATDTDFTWKSSDTSVATVSSSGVVTAKKLGECIITCSNGRLKATTDIVVNKKVNCTSIEISPYETSLAAGKTKTLSVSFTPSNTSDKTVSWSSSNNKVATVDSNGKVTAIKSGSVTITCKTSNGKKATAVVRVNVAVTGIRFINTTYKCSVGESKTISCTILPYNASDKTLVWTSSKPAVATVSSKGVVKGLTQGTTTITATTPDGKFTATCKVKVAVEVTGVKLAKSKLTLKKNESAAMLATIVPSNATNKNVTWKSNNESVAIVEDGLVTAKKTGTAVITVKTKDGGYTASVYVKVIQPVEQVKLKYSSLNLNVGYSKQVTYYVTPSYATNTKVTWSSSNKKVAKVSGAGLIKAVAPGECTITCASNDGYAKSTVKVKVIQAVTGVKFKTTVLNVPKGSTKTLKAVVKPSTATNKEVTWATNNSSVATVDSSGNVKGLSYGSCTITVTTQDGLYTAQCKVNVYAKVTGITLNKTAVTIEAGKKTTITPTIKPSKAAIKTVTWSSNNKDVATVDKNGVVTTHEPGYAVITAKTKDGGYKATCRINVIRMVTGVKLTSSIDLDVDEVTTLKATVIPKDATNKLVKWSSSDKKVVKVDSTGKLTAVGLGSATITVKTEDGGYCATCNVTVIHKVHEVTLSSTRLTVYLDTNPKLTATISPKNATDKDVTWSSKDQSVCLVSQSGKLTPVKVGTTKIICESEQGEVKGVCVVTVERKASKITLSALDKTVNVGETVTITPTIAPASTTDKTVTWTSSDTSIATVSSKGVVKGKSAGTVTITATVCGDVTKTIKITVV